MLSRLIYVIIGMSVLCLSGCGYGGGVYYGHHYGADPFYHHGVYVRDRVHYVSDDDVRALEELDSATMPHPEEFVPDMGMGETEEFGGFD